MPKIKILLYELLYLLQPFSRDLGKVAVVEAVPAETTDAETASDDETEGMKDDDVMAPNNRIGNFKHFHGKGS